MNLSLAYGQISTPNSPVEAVGLMPAGYAAPTDADASALAIGLNEYMSNPGPGSVFATATGEELGEGE